MKTARPRQYWDDYASRFKNRSLAELYELRPPYPHETYEILLNLLGESQGKVLDVGCGPGKIARIRSEDYLGKTTDIKRKD